MVKSKTSNRPEPITEILGHGETGEMLRVKQAQLSVVDGPDQGLIKAIPPHGLVVGTSRLCSFMLTDSAVSSKHFRIIPKEQGFLIQDLCSRNGTWFHGARLNEIFIGGMGTFSAGISTLRLELLDTHRDYPLFPSPVFGNMVGGSVAMRQAFALLARAAASDTTLLIEGESGTGKDLAAETVHLYSARREEPFIVVDCSSMQPNLVVSKLFGHKKGAFTGAHADHIGAFEAAEGGTVFLDEIGELDPSLQPKLLRVLEKRQIQRLGDTDYRPVDVRLIAATNRDVETEVEGGRFRRDLFYRLSVLRVHLPALRDRCEDISDLAAAFIEQLKPDINPEDILTTEMRSLLRSHDWPGNVRELRNFVERLLVFPEWPAIEHINRSKMEPKGKSAAIDLPFLNARDMVIEKFEKEYVEALIEECQGNVSLAAEKSKVSRQTLHRLMNKYRISK